MAIVVKRLTKRADWKRAYDFDFAPFAEFAEDTPQTITGTPTLASSPSGLTTTAPTVSGPRAQTVISGGDAGVVYTLTCTASLSGGGVLSIQGELEVVD